MAIINYTDQIKYAGRGYLDAKMMPVNTVDDLYAISLTQRFEGLTITVLNNGNPQDYWLVGGVTNSCWIPKTATNFNELKLALEDGFLKLYNSDTQLGEAINFNDFFPEDSDLYISAVDYTTTNEDGTAGIFICFTYSDNSKKYLDMSQFLSNVYEAGEGVVINGNVISISDALLGRVDTLESTVSTLTKSLENKAEKNTVEELSQRIADEESARIDEDILLQKAIETVSETLNSRETVLNDLQTRLNSLQNTTDTNTKDINTNKINIENLQKRVDELGAAEGLTPDGKTISLNDKKELEVKIYQTEGNILGKNENGLFVTIPIFYEDEELNNQ